MFYKPSDDKKIAVVASKKVGKAVIRNKAKRRLRSAFVNVSSELENGVYIMVAKSGIDSAEFDKIQKNLKWSLKKLGCLK